MWDEIKQQLKYLSFGRVKQQAFIEDLNSLIEDGVPAQQAIAAISKVSEGSTKEVAQSIMNAFAAGKALADGLEGWFPHHIVEVIRTGEAGGSLTNTLKSTGTALSQSVSVASSFVSSLAYPLIVLILACVVAIFLRHSIFTSFIAIRPINLWPENGRTLYHIASFIEVYWWAVLLLVAGVVVGLVQLFHKLIGETRTLLDKMIPFSLYRMAVAARLMETLGLLISNGITFKDSLNILQRDTTRFLMWHLYMMQVRLSGGRDNIAEVLDTGLLSKEDISRLMIIAQGKGFDYALVRLGARAMQKNSKKLQLVAKILGGLILALDAFFAIYMILAVYAVGMSLGGVGM